MGPVCWRQKLRLSATELARQTKGLAPESCLPNWHCLPAALHSSSPNLTLPPLSHLDPGSPGIITLHVQEFIHINLQLGDLLFLGWGGGGGRDKGLSWGEGKRGACWLRPCPTSGRASPLCPADSSSCSEEENRSGPCQGKLPDWGRGGGNDFLSASWAP